MGWDIRATKSLGREAIYNSFIDSEAFRVIHSKGGIHGRELVRDGMGRLNSHHERELGSMDTQMYQGQ